MKIVPDLITRSFGRQILQVQKVSPTLLFGVGIVGVVATAVLASKATLKLEETLDDIDKDKRAAKEVLGEGTDTRYTESDYRKDMILIQFRAVSRVAKLYAPAVGVGIISVGCLTGSHYILTQRNIALTAAYATLEKGFSEYRRRVIGEVGEDREREIYYDAQDKAVVNAKGETSLVKVPNSNLPSVYARFFDESSPSWNRRPEYNLVFLRCQQNWANDLLKARGHVFLNEVYDMLGIERTKAGAVVGWVLGGEGDDYISFGVYDSDNERARAFVNGNEPSILLDFNVDGVIYDKI